MTDNPKTGFRQSEFLFVFETADKSRAHSSIIDVSSDPNTYLSEDCFSQDEAEKLKEYLISNLEKYGV